jgi:hypothetical protein
VVVKSVVESKFDTRQVGHCIDFEIDLSVVHGDIFQSLVAFVIRSTFSCRLFVQILLAANAPISTTTPRSVMPTSLPAIENIPEVYSV